MRVLCRCMQSRKATKRAHKGARAAVWNRRSNASFYLVLAGRKGDEEKNDFTLSSSIDEKDDSATLLLFRTAAYHVMSSIYSTEPPTKGKMSVYWLLPASVASKKKKQRRESFGIFFLVGIEVDLFLPRGLDLVFSTFSPVPTASNCSSARFA